MPSYPQKKVTQQSNNKLKKTQTTKSCQNLLCLTNHCYQDQKKQKQKSLNYQYFQKLSLKKFTQNSIILNQSIYQKEHKNNINHNSKTDQIFHNINLNSKNTYNNKDNQKGYLQQGAKYSLTGQLIHPIIIPHNIGDDSRRIIRSSSQKIFTRPILNSDRSIQQEIQFQYKRIQDLQKLRKTLQLQIKTLDKSIDKYYSIYHQKIQELKKIQNKLFDIQKQKQLQTKPSEQEKSFKKRPYNDNITPKQYIHSNFNHNKQNIRFKIQNQNYQKVMK